MFVCKMYHTKTVIQDLNIEVHFNKFNPHAGFLTDLSYWWITITLYTVVSSFVLTRSLVYKFSRRWLSQAETCRRVYFVIIQFKYLSTVSAFYWNFIIVSLMHKCE
jgi:hypothetical protein